MLLARSHEKTAIKLSSARRLSHDKSSFPGALSDLTSPLWQDWGLLQIEALIFFQATVVLSIPSPAPCPIRRCQVDFNTWKYYCQRCLMGSPRMLITHGSLLTPSRAGLAIHLPVVEIAHSIWSLFMLNAVDVRLVAYWKSREMVGRCRQTSIRSLCRIANERRLTANDGVLRLEDPFKVTWRPTHCQSQHTLRTCFRQQQPTNATSLKAEDGLQPKYA